MRTVVEHNYDYFTIYKMWGDAGSEWHWVMDDEQLAEASFFKGVLRLADAFDKTIIGTVFQGFFEYRQAGEHLSRYMEFQHCVNDVDTEWFCLHGLDHKLNTSFLQVTDQAIVPPGKSLVVLEGSVRAKLAEGTVTVNAMNHLKPRPYPIHCSGNAKAFVLSKGPPKVLHPPISHDTHPVAVVD